MFTVWPCQSFVSASRTHPPTGASEPHERRWGLILSTLAFTLMFTVWLMFGILDAMLLLGTAVHGQ